MSEGNSKGRKMRNLEGHKVVVRVLVRVCLAVVGLAVGLAVLSQSVPEEKKLRALEAKLASAIEREKEAKEKKERVEVEHQALRNDQEFLEIHARDRLDYYRKGEKVLRFRQD